MIYEVIINITSYWFITRLKFSRPNEVDSDEVAISIDTYELTGREVSSLLSDDAQDDGSRWISTAVITYSFYILDLLFIAYLRHEFYNSTLFTKQVWHTQVVDTFKDVLMQKLTESGHPPPYINFIISVHGEVK